MLYLSYVGIQNTKSNMEKGQYLDPGNESIVGTHSFQTILINTNAEKPGAFIVSQLRLHLALKKCYCIFCLSHS